MSKKINPAPVRVLEHTILATRLIYLLFVSLAPNYPLLSILPPLCSLASRNQEPGPSLGSALSFPFRGPLLLVCCMKFDRIDLTILPNIEMMACKVT